MVKPKTIKVGIHGFLADVQVDRWAGVSLTLDQKVIIYTKTIRSLSIPKQLRYYCRYIKYLAGVQPFISRIVHVNLA